MNTLSKMLKFLHGCLSYLEESYTFVKNNKLKFGSTNKWFFFYYFSDQTRKKIVDPMLNYTGHEGRKGKKKNKIEKN